MDASSANIETRNCITRDVYHSTLVAHSRRARRGAGVCVARHMHLALPRLLVATFGSSMARQESRHCALKFYCVLACLST